MEGTGSPLGGRKKPYGYHEAKQMKIKPEAERRRKSDSGDKCKIWGEGATHIEPEGATHAEPKGATHIEPKGATHIEPKGATHIEPKGATHIEPEGATNIEPNWGIRTENETNVEKQRKNESFRKGQRTEESCECLAKKDRLHNGKRKEGESERQGKMEEKQTEAQSEPQTKMDDPHKDKKAEAESKACDNKKTARPCTLAWGHGTGTDYKVPHFEASVEEHQLQQPQEKSSTEDLRSSTQCIPRSRNVCVHHSAFFREMVVVLIVGGMYIAVGGIYAFSAVALPQWDGIHTSLNFSVEEGKWIASIPILTSIPGMLISGVLAETFGCRICLLVGCPILMTAWVAIVFAQSLWHILLARTFQGLILAICLVTVNVYSVEIGSTHHRGILVTTTEVMLMFGILFTYTLGIFMSPSSIAIVMVAQLLLVLCALRFIPNSPVWLLKKGRVSESIQTLQYLRGKSCTEEEVNKMGASILEQRNEAKDLKTQLKLLKNKDVLKPLSITVCILLAKELTGQYVTVAYTVQIFQMAGSSNDPFWCSFYMGLMRFFSVFICWFLMERIPRRTLLISGQLLGCAGMATVGLFLLSPKLGANPEVLNIYGWIPLFGVLAFTFAHMAGVAATSWALVVELQPSSVRNISSGIVNSLFVIFQFLLVLSFPDLVKLVGTGGVFIFYATGGLAGALFVACFVPETKGRSLAHIQMHIQNKGQTELTPV